MSNRRKFASVGEFAAYLTRISRALDPSLREGLMAIGETVKVTAKAKIGHYQTEVPPYAFWQPLSSTTIRERLAKGWTPDDPLLRSGELRESIEFVVVHRTVAIGSDLKIAAWMELGTIRIPPRAFLGPAMIESKLENVQHLRRAVERAFEGRP
jgi:hypothetical protein